MLKSIIQLLILLVFINSAHAQEANYELLGDYKAGGYVYSVSISLDGSYVAASSADKIVYFFSREGKTLWTYARPDVSKKILVSSNGSYIAASSEKNIYFFNREGMLLWNYNGELLWSYRVDATPFNSISISSDGSLIGAGSDMILYLLDNKGRLILQRNTGSLGSISSLSISSNGSYIAAGSENSIYLYNRDATPYWSYRTDNKVRIVSISSDGSFLSALSGDNIYFFNIDRRLLLKKSQPGVSAISVSSNGSYIATGSGKNIYLFNKEGVILWSYNTNYSVADVKVSSDGSVVSAGSGSNIYIFNREGTLLWSYKADNDILSIAISSNGSLVAAGSKDDKVYFIGKKASISTITPAPIIQSTYTEPTSITTTSTPMQTSEPLKIIPNATAPVKSTPFPSVLQSLTILIAAAFIYRTLD